MSMWDVYASYFDGGIPYGEYISTILILGLCAYGLYKAKHLYKDL